MEDLCKKLDLAILDTLMKKEVSFIVMNHFIALRISIELSQSYQYKLSSYRGYEVLISKSLDYGEFRIG